MIHHMRLHAEPFKQFKFGKKQIELRINDPKRQMVKVGDEIVFTSRKSREELTFKVIGRVLFSDFKTLVKYMTADKCGFTEDAPHGYKEEWMGNIYSREDIEKYGALGLVLAPSLPSNASCC